MEGSLKIGIIGSGGAGNNIVDNLMKSGIVSAECSAVNTDAQHLSRISAHKKILIGKRITKGLGAGGSEEIGRKAAESDSKFFTSMDYDLVFLCAGLGGGTGGGSAPVIARTLKESGATVVSFATLPFKLERSRMKKAKIQALNLLSSSDGLVLLENEKLVSVGGSLGLKSAFSMIDDFIGRAIKAISDTVNLPSMMNIDFSDLRSVFRDSSLCTIGKGRGTGYSKVEDAVDSTLKNRFLEYDSSLSRGCLVQLEAGPDLTMGDAIRIAEGITEKLGSSAEVKVGARVNPVLSREVVCTAVFSGISSPVLEIEGRKETEEMFL